MIVLDTNVLSELMRRESDPRVLAWAGAVDPADIRLTSIAQAEILAGVALLPPGRRRESLAAAAADAFAQFPADRILAFDAAAAVEYGLIVARRTKAGRPISPLDAQIAAIVLSRRATLATRNTRDFVECGIALVDPWAA